MKDSSSSSQLEICPYCGKPFKRLKSHLPHCKLAKASENHAFSNAQKSASKSQINSKKTKEQKNMLVEPISIKNHKSKLGKTTESKTLKKKLQELSEAPALQTELFKVKKRKETIHKAGEQHWIDSMIMEANERPLFEGQDVSKNSEEMYNSPISNLPEIKHSLLMEHSQMDQKSLNVNQPILGIKLSEIQNPTHQPNVEPAEEVTEVISETNLTGKVIAQANPAEAYVIKPENVPVSKNNISEVQCNQKESLVTVTTEAWKDMQDSFYRKSCSEQISDVCSSNTKSSQAPSISNLIGTFSLESMQAIKSTSTLESIQTSGMCHDGFCNHKTVERIRHGFEGCTETTSSKTATFPRIVEPTCSLGLQWFPELYPNYMRLHLIPGRQIYNDIQLNFSMAKSPLTTNHGIPLAVRRLMDVRLKELPTWLISHFSPKTIPGAVQNGGPPAWGQYYHKYINVRKGGVGGLTMLLVGYCILSYTWNYEHTKQDRWRKYH